MSRSLFCHCACKLAHPDIKDVCELRRPVATVPAVTGEFPGDRTTCRPCAEARGVLLLPW